MIFEKIFEVMRERIVWPSRDEQTRLGFDPHAIFEQSHPAVNKDEPVAFANAIESGAKKFSEEACGKPMPSFFDRQPGSDYVCPTDAHTRAGSGPHATFVQSHPAVNKAEPLAFANPCESGAKKPSEAQFGKPMREGKTYCQ